MIVVDSGGPWLSKTANNLPVFLYCIMTACKDRPDIKGGEIAYNSKVLWGTMLVMFVWMVILVISQGAAK